MNPHRFEGLNSASNSHSSHTVHYLQTSLFGNLVCVHVLCLGPFCRICSTPSPFYMISADAIFGTPNTFLPTMSPIPNLLPFDFMRSNPPPMMLPPPNVSFGNPTVPRLVIPCACADCCRVQHTTYSTFSNMTEPLINELTTESRVRVFELDALQAEVETIQIKTEPQENNNEAIDLSTSSQQETFPSRSSQEDFLPSSTTPSASEIARREHLARMGSVMGPRFRNMSWSPE